MSIKIYNGYILRKKMTLMEATDYSARMNPAGS